MEDCVRIIHIVTHMNKGGLERRLMDLYREIDRSKFQFDFLCLSDQEGFFDKEIEKLGGKLFHLSYLSIRNYRGINKQLVSFFKEHPEYKIVHCHLNQWSGLILRSAKLAGVPIRIAHSRTSLRTKNLKNFIKNVIKLNTNIYATHKMAVSEKAASWLFGKRSVENNEVEILPNAIKMSEYTFKKDLRSKYRSKLNIDNSLVVMHVGNLKPEKNHKFLIDIFFEIKEKVDNAQLVLVGEGSLKGEIQKKISEKGLTNSVKLLGSREDINHLLQAGDIFIFPSFYEGFPGAVLEAQVSGLPCVISDTITKEVMITDRVIQMALSDEPRKWANKTLNMFNIFKDSRAVDEIDMNYDISFSANILISFYNNILKETTEVKY